MKSVKKTVFAIALSCATLAEEAHTKTETIPQYFIQVMEDKIAGSIWKHFDFSRRQVYLRLEGGRRKYSSRITGFTTRPKTSQVFGYGIGYRFTDYPMRIEFSVQKNNFKMEEGATLLKSRTQNFSVNLYRDFALPKALVSRFPLAGRLTPYITAGVGQAIHSKIEYAYTKSILPGLPLLHAAYQLQRVRNTSWQTGLGTKLILAKQLSVDCAISHIDQGNITIVAGDNNIKAKIRGRQYMLALIVNM